MKTIPGSYLTAMFVTKRASAAFVPASRRALSAIPVTESAETGTVEPKNTGRDVSLQQQKRKSLFQEIDEFFDDMMRPPADIFDHPFGRLMPVATKPLFSDMMGELELRRTSPRYEIMEGEDDWKVAVDVPGLRSDDVKVEFNSGSNTLRLSGGKKKEEEGSTYESHFEKHFRLGNNVDVEGVTANVADGVLIVTLPKDEQFMDVRSIPVSSEALPPGKEKEEMVETLKE